MKPKKSYRYRVVDVFTSQPLEGNPLAVFPDPGDLDGLTMQRIAKELNLSETVFFLPATRSDCSAALRIFTPTRELPFAGHPTVGASYVLLDEGIVPKGSEHFTVEEQIGPIPIRVESGDDPLIWLTTPPIRDGRRFERAACANALGLNVDDLLDIPPQIVSAGNPNLFIALKSKELVDRAWVDMSGARALRAQAQEPFCIFVFTPTADGAYSRMFAPEYGVSEDPATGSATGPLASYMLRHNLLKQDSAGRSISEQGTKMGRRSILHIHVMKSNGAEIIEVGGNVTPLLEGVMKL